MLGTTTKRGGILDVSRTLAAMPTAALADIHGNLPALEAVLADPRCAAADSVVVLGDVVTGTFPAETFDRVTALDKPTRFLRGNADRLALDDPAAWYGWVRDRLGPERIEAAAAAVRASGQPNADDAVETLLTPPTPEEATARWEQSRLQ
jgi:Calcineurin-like phosphoesterase